MLHTAAAASPPDDDDDDPLVLLLLLLLSAMGGLKERLLLHLGFGICSPDGVLEMEPMDSYSRLLLHCLADIFGFFHVSVGEGDARHLVLERCPETSMSH